MVVAKATQRKSGRVAPAQFPETSAWDRTGFLLWHAMLEWRRKVTDALEEVGLTYVQFSLLASASYLNHRGPSPSQAELAEHTGMDVMMTSQVVRTLERERLVKRIADKNDARVKRIIPTNKGESIVSTAIGLVNDINDEVFGLIEDIDRFKEALRLVADRDIDGRRTQAR
jgi:DNA-binding MarR family transcriptional regulator